MAENSNNPIDALHGLIKASLLDVNTAIPAEIVSYKNGRASVKPAVKKRFADGDALEYPIVPNVRVCWPSFAGGAAGVKGPVQVGDRCLLIIAQQAVDGTDDRRMFDLQDAYAVMVDLGNAGAGDSGDNASMTMYFGGAYIRITEGGMLEINAPGGAQITSPSITQTGSLTVNGNVLGAGISLNTHTHPGDSGGTTGPPNP